jgi:hypothetical protein
VKFSSNSSTYALKRLLIKRGIRFLLLAAIVLSFFLICLKIGLISYFQYLLLKVGFLLAGRGLSFLLVLVSLTLVYRIRLSKRKKSFLLLFRIWILVFFLCFLFRFFIFQNIVDGMTAAAADLAPLILNVSSGGELGETRLPPLESSSSPGSSSPSTSLEGHASSSSSEGDFSSTLSQFPSPSTSTATPDNQSIDSSPNTEQKESLEFLSDQGREQWKTIVIQAFNERVAEVDPQGKIDEDQIVDALRLDSSWLTRADMENMCRDLWKRPWPSSEAADRTSSYPRIWELLEKNKRHSI